MNKIKNHSDYVVIASLCKSDNINVSVTFRGENTPDNLYILNEFEYNTDDLKLFKDIFNIFSSPHKPAEFSDFFVDNGKFYAAFKYTQAEDITHLYQKDICTATFDERCIILENILVKIDSICRYTPQIACCLTEPQNIRVDKNKNIHMIYNLKNIQKYSTADYKTIFANIREIIFTMLRAESEAGFNKQLHIVLDKCSSGVYTSVPQLAIELKKAEKISKTSSWITYIKYQIGLRKPLIQKLSKASLTAVIVAGIFYLAYSKINENTAPGTAAIAVSIGDVTYNGNKEDESEKAVSAQNIDSQTGADTSDITLTEGLDMQYEDYIVQYGDTVSSICEAYYKDSRYITAIATFNGVASNEKLTAGTILKLPNRTAIALYTSR